MWIEAVAPTPGAPENADRVPELPPAGAVYSVDNAKITLRLTSALSKKIKRHKERPVSGSVRPDEPFVVAINGYDCSRGCADPGEPRILRAVFGCGHMAIDLGGQGESRISLNWEPEITRLGKPPVPSAIFGARASAEPSVSAIIYAWNSVFMHAALAGGRLGRDLVLVHNPFAPPHLRLPHGFLGIGQEWCAELAGDEITAVRSWRYEA